MSVKAKERRYVMTMTGVLYNHLSVGRGKGGSTTIFMVFTEVLHNRRDIKYCPPNPGWDTCTSIKVFRMYRSIDKTPCFKKNLYASRPSEHPPVRGGNVKTFRWDHRLQIQNLSAAFQGVPRWY